MSPVTATYQDTDAAELTIELSQPIELGGKRRLRREAAELGRQLAANGQKLARAEVLATTRQRFVAVLAAQEGLALAKEQAELAEKSLTAAEERIKAGKAPTIDRLRLQGEASLARLAVTQAERTLVTARQALAASWGEAQPDFDRVAGDLSLLPAAPEPSDVEATLEQTPAAANRRIATELRGNELAQAKARRIPDPSLTVGWRQFEESDEDAWLFGVSFPLPLFNQGQDEVAAASSRFNGAKARELSARNQARSTLRTAWQAFADARAEAEVLANQVVPAATEGFAAAEFGYRAGKFGLLELLDAQRALFEARQRQLDRADGLSSGGHRTPAPPGPRSRRLPLPDPISLERFRSCSRLAISSRLLLIIGVGALGWVGGSRFAHQDEAADPHGHEAQRPSGKPRRTCRQRPRWSDHAEEKDEHAGHGHGKPADSGEICAEHRMPEAEDVLCNPQLMTTLLPGEGVKMRLATPEAAARAGIVIAAAQKTSVAGGPAIPAQVTYNRSRLAEVMALSGGVVRRIAAEPGQSVGKGALLAEIASPGAAIARGDYQAALGRLELAEANVRREQELVAKGVSARMELEQAQAEQQAAKATAEQLREQLTAFGAGTSAGGGTQLALRSPLAGTVVARNAAVGQTLAPETPLFTVADLSSMWLELQLSADQLAPAKVGAAIEAEIDGLPGQRFPGKIIQVAAGLDERTRLLRVVAEIANPDGILKDGMFGQARLVAAAEADR